MNWTRQTQVCVAGIQTESKRPERHVPGVYPNFIDSGDGAYVTCGDKKYVDWSSALGPLILGHAHPLIVETLLKTAKKGSLFNLPHKSEGELADLIVDMIPSAEMCRFLKTGTDATTAAVRIARAYTNAETVVCMGYHGWADWYQGTAQDNVRGIPKQRTVKVKHGTDMVNIFKRYKKIACVIMEPYIWKDPGTEYIRKLQHLCKANGTVLIFDECITGFRTLKHSAQAYWNVIPDMTCLSKAMAGGVPISCVCGKRELMQVLDNGVFVSGTFNADLLGIETALAVVKFLRDNPVANQIWNVGGRLKGAFQNVVNNLGMSDHFKASGVDCRPRFEFPSNAHKALFWQECLKRGVMWDDACFPNYAHNTPELDKTGEAIRESMRLLKKYYEEPKAILEGEVCSEDFKT